MIMKFNEITEPKTNAAPVTAPVAVPKSDEKALQPDATFATRDQIKQLAANLAHDMPDVRLKYKPNQVFLISESLVLISKQSQII